MVKVSWCIVIEHSFPVTKKQKLNIDCNIIKSGINLYKLIVVVTYKTVLLLYWLYRLKIKCSSYHSQLYNIIRATVHAKLLNKGFNTRGETGT